LKASAAARRLLVRHTEAVARVDASSSTVIVEESEE